MINNEANLIKKIEKWWTKNGALVLKFHGNQFTRQGTPDLLICYEGRFIALEVKIGSNKPKPIQLEMIKRIKEWYGGIAEWVNEENWLEISEGIMNGKKQ